MRSGGFVPFKFSLLTFCTKTQQGYFAAAMRQQNNLFGFLKCKVQDVNLHTRRKTGIADYKCGLDWEFSHVLIQARIKQHRKPQCGQGSEMVWLRE